MKCGPTLGEVLSIPCRVHDILRYLKTVTIGPGFYLTYL